MKYVNVILLLVALSGNSSCVNAGNSKQTAASSQATINRKVPVAEFDTKLSSVAGAQLVDVRSAEEYAGGHLKNAVNIDVRSDNFEQQLSRLDRSKPIFVYCASGNRSTKAAGIMEGLGFTEIYNMDGGISDWRSTGKPVE